MKYLGREGRRIERLLRDARPEPSAELVRVLTPRRVARRQFAFAGALTAALLIGLALVGGASYAANAVNHAVKVAKRTVAPAKHHRSNEPGSISAGHDQYKPGYGWGDKNHNHTGPPGLKGGGAGPGEKAPPGQTKKAGKGTLVNSTISSDEQAAIYLSVLDSKGVQLLMTQKGTKIGDTAAEGVQTKNIHFVMLVPRTAPLTIRVPANLLTPGQTYRIRIIAVDPQGNKTRTFIPFVA